MGFSPQHIDMSPEFEAMLDEIVDELGPRFASPKAPRHPDIAPRAWRWRLWLWRRWCALARMMFH